KSNGLRKGVHQINCKCVSDMLQPEDFSLVYTNNSISRDLLAQPASQGNSLRTPLPMSLADYLQCGKVLFAYE
ncbi:unnamed protein product, partial [Ceratitis capitata]